VELKTPYLLFLGDAPDQLAAKTAQGVRDWRPDLCTGQFRFPGCRADLKLPDLSIEEAVEQGARTLIVGVANRGGVISDAWIEVLLHAMKNGLDLAAGLHSRLIDVPEIATGAAHHGRKVHDVRHPTQKLAVASGEKRAGRRLLAVGTDCSVGKMYTTLAIEKEMRARGMNADFRATGQTGIFIAGGGISVDAVIADFISGAVEWLAPANAADHWDVIEGQGSLFHASFAGVTLGLIHGSQPDALVLCHEPTREHMRGLPGYRLPDLGLCMETNLQAARLTNPQARFVGLSVNTSGIPEGDRHHYLGEVADRFGLPAVDPFWQGAGPLVDELQRQFP
jgi:uncharacterized NAD-dependent epimerase/dehydratase family protein